MRIFKVESDQALDDTMRQMLTTVTGLSANDATLVLDLSRKILDDCYGVVQRVSTMAPEELGWHIAVQALIRLNISSRDALVQAGVQILTERENNGI